MEERIKILTSIKEMLEKFKIDIAYQTPALCEMFLSKKDNVSAPLLHSIAENLNSGMTSCESAENAVKNTASLSILSCEERTFLIELFSSMGTSDCDGQLALINNSIEKLRLYIDNAIANKNKNAKVYMTLSVYLGIALSVMLL